MCLLLFLFWFYSGRGAPHRAGAIDRGRPAGAYPLFRKFFVQKAPRPAILVEKAAGPTPAPLERGVSHECNKSLGLEPKHQ